MGMQKYRTDRFNLWFQKNTPGTELEEGFDAKDLPEDYQRVKYELVSKTAVDAWKDWQAECEQVKKAAKAVGDDDPTLPPSPLPPGVKVTQTIGLRMK
jgi:hypothetical protein